LQLLSIPVQFATSLQIIIFAVKSSSLQSACKALVCASSVRF
jgi:hypothetical protein